MKSCTELAADSYEHAFWLYLNWKLLASVTLLSSSENERET